jgi:TatD DNase family protein
MVMTLVDAHCHLDHLPKYKIHPGLLPVTVGYSHSSNQKAVVIAKEHGIPFVLGIAPQTAIKADLSMLDGWVAFIRESRPNAIGEIGLDYHWAKSEQDVEKEKIVFERMLELAEEMRLPVVIHARQATHDTLDFLQLRNFNHGFMLHFFSGTLTDAKRAADMGGFVSIPPLHSKERRMAIEAVDLGQLLVETDAPYVSKTPDDVSKAVEYIAEVKGLSTETVEKRTAANAKRFFGIK